MAWRNIVITQHCKIKYKLNQLVIQTDGDVYQIPLEDIQAIVVTTTRAVITTYAIAEIIKSGIKIVFSDLNGLPIGEINAYHLNSNRNQNIHKQIEWGTSDKALLWSKIVQCKIQNQIALLNDYRVTDIERINALLATIEVGDTSNREAVAARLYFPRLFGHKFVRSEENIGINDMLDYGYSILSTAVAREISAAGYLTELAIHHEGSQNHYNLASDLMEPFRPMIDRIVKRHEEEIQLTNDIKFELIDVLNQSLNVNGKEMLLTQAISDVVRTTVGYLNHETTFPDWHFEI
jgi:CRISPR-associated protein Cas1